MGALRNQVRIIGGQWRGRKLQFPDIDGLRPTPDRIRETVFNWLAPVITGARCLDLCAGSGIFGIEAVSRGAASALLVEKDARAVAAIRAATQNLGSDHIQVQQADVIAFLSAPQPAATFDIVFVDPPYRLNLLPDCLRLLSTQPWLNAGALIYFEHDKTSPPPPLPPAWTLLKEKQAGQVAYRLARHERPPLA